MNLKASTYVITEPEYELSLQEPLEIQQASIRIPLLVSIGNFRHLLSFLIRLIMLPYFYM